VGVARRRRRLRILRYGRRRRLLRSDARGNPLRRLHVVRQARRLFQRGGGRRCRAVVGVHCQLNTVITEWIERMAEQAATSIQTNFVVGEDDLVRPAVRFPTPPPRPFSQAREYPGNKDDVTLQARNGTQNIFAVHGSDVNRFPLPLTHLLDQQRCFVPQEQRRLSRQTNSPRCTFPARVQ
jgi:hypothetical protein